MPTVYLVGDRVISYDPLSRKYFIGEVISNYLFDLETIEGYPNIRKVKWGEPINRDDLSTKTRNSLSSTLTLFSLNDEVFQELSDVQNGSTSLDRSRDVEQEIEDPIEEKTRVSRSV